MWEELSWRPCCELSDLKKEEDMNTANIKPRRSFPQMYEGVRQYCWKTRMVT